MPQAPKGLRVEKFINSRNAGVILPSVCHDFAM
jgi:hypothetical protein